MATKKLLVNFTKSFVVNNIKRSSFDVIIITD